MSEDKSNTQEGKVKKCKICGCTDNKACPGGCHWVAPDVCSRCAEKQGRQGWGFPEGSRKAHYFIIEPGHNMGDSLCRGYGFYGGPTEQGNDDSPDNCIRCKKLKKIMDG